MSEKHETVANEAAIRKMKALLTLAKGTSAEARLSSSTEAEAAVAANKLQQMLLRYNLSADSLEEMGQTVGEMAVGEQTLSVLNSPMEVWYQHLLHAVVEVCSCRMFFYTDSKYVRGKIKKSYRITLAGRPLNVAMARELFSYLSPLAYSLGYKEAKGEKLSAAWYASFKQGYAIRMAERLRKKQAEMQEKGLEKETGEEAVTGLVVASFYEKELMAVKGYLAKLNLRTVPGKNWNILDNDGYQKGQAAGEQVSLHQQISA
jgi:hypothetical protein